MGVASAPARPADPALVAATAALDSLEKSFLRARASLESEEKSLRDANRLDTSYIAKYAAFEHRRAAATELRASRDRARRVRDSIVARTEKPAVQKH